MRVSPFSFTTSCRRHVGFSVNARHLGTRPPAKAVEIFHQWRKTDSAPLCQSSPMPFSSAVVTLYLQCGGGCRHFWIYPQSGGSAAIFPTIGGIAIEPFPSFRDQLAALGLKTQEQLCRWCRRHARYGKFPCRCFFSVPGISGAAFANIGGCLLLRLNFQQQQSHAVDFATVEQRAERRHPPTEEVTHPPMAETSPGVTSRHIASRMRHGRCVTTSANGGRTAIASRGTPITGTHCRTGRPLGFSCIAGRTATLPQIEEVESRLERGRNLPG